MVWVTSDMPADQMNACMNGRTESHLVTNSAVPFGESLHSWNNGVDVLEVFSFVKVSHHPTDINSPMAELGILPVNDEKSVWFLAWLLFFLPWNIREQDTDFR